MMKKLCRLFGISLAWATNGKKKNRQSDKDVSVQNEHTCVGLSIRPHGYASSERCLTTDSIRSPYRLSRIRVGERGESFLSERVDGNERKFSSTFGVASTIALLLLSPLLWILCMSIMHINCGVIRRWRRRRRQLMSGESERSQKFMEDECKSLSDAFCSFSFVPNRLPRRGPANNWNKFVISCI